MAVITACDNENQGWSGRHRQAREESGRRRGQQGEVAGAIQFLDGTPAEDHDHHFGEMEGTENLVLFLIGEAVPNTGMKLATTEQPWRKAASSGNACGPYL